jgi:NDP-sugar pyrophosphorylase family protein
MQRLEKVRARPRRLEDAPAGLKDVTAAILAGGMGTRLRSVLADRPKVLAPVHGRPYLTHLLDQLAAAGISAVVLLTGHGAGQVSETLGASYADMRLIHSPEVKPLGTGGALRNALSKLTSADVLLQNGDSWCDVELADFLKFHRMNDAELSVVLVKAADPSRFGQVRVAADERVVCFEEKTAGGSGWINAGIYLIARSLIREIQAEQDVSLEREMIPRWIQEGKKVFGYRHTGRFLDIGTPESYAAAERFIPKSVRDSATV